MLPRARGKMLPTPPICASMRVTERAASFSMSEEQRSDGYLLTDMEAPRGMTARQSMTAVQITIRMSALLPYVSAALTMLGVLLTEPMRRD